jgi:hypothetical protein
MTTVRKPLEPRIAQVEVQRSWSIGAENAWFELQMEMML